MSVLLGKQRAKCQGFVLAEKLTLEENDPFLSERCLAVTYLLPGRTQGACCIYKLQRKVFAFLSEGKERNVVCMGIILTFYPEVIYEEDYVCFVCVTHSGFRSLTVGHIKMDLRAQCV